MEDGNSRNQQREEANSKSGLPQDRRLSRGTTRKTEVSAVPNANHRKVSIVDKSSSPEPVATMEVPRGDENYADDFELEIDEEIRVLPQKSTGRAALPTNDLPPPPSYRHFADGPSSPKEAFSIENTTKAQEDGNGSAQKGLDNLSRKERLAILRQQAMDRVQQKKKEDDEHRRK